MGYLLLKDSETTFLDFRPVNTCTLHLPSGKAVMIWLRAQFPKLSTPFSKDKEEQSGAQTGGWHHQEPLWDCGKQVGQGGWVRGRDGVEVRQLRWATVYFPQPLLK